MWNSNSTGQAYTFSAIKNTEFELVSDKSTKPEVHWICKCGCLHTCFLKRFFFKGSTYNLMGVYNCVYMTSVLFYWWQALFREELLPQFLTVLLHSLVHKSHALLGEEIAVALYNMAAVNFVAFHDAFLPQFLHSTDGLDDGQRSILQRNFKTDTVSYI